MLLWSSLCTFSCFHENSYHWVSYDTLIVLEQIHWILKRCIYCQYLMNILEITLWDKWFGKLITRFMQSLYWKYLYPKHREDRWHFPRCFCISIWSLQYNIFYLSLMLATRSTHLGRERFLMMTFLDKHRPLPSNPCY